MPLYIQDGQSGYEADLDNLVRALQENGVLTGCAVAAQGTPNLTVAVAAGTIQWSGVSVTVGGVNVAISAGGASPRVDLVYVSSAGTPARVEGTPAATPKPPALPANSILLAFVSVAAGAVNVQNSNITNRIITVATATLAHAASHNVAGSDTPIPLKYLDLGDKAAVAVPVDWTAATTQKFRMTGNPTNVTFSAAPPAGTWLALVVAQDGTGGRVLPALPTIKWIGGSTPTPTVTASKKDIYTLFYDGTDYIGSGAMNA